LERQYQADQCANARKLHNLHKILKWTNPHSSNYSVDFQLENEHGGITLNVISVKGIALGAGLVTALSLGIAAQASAATSESSATDLVTAGQSLTKTDDTTGLATTVELGTPQEVTVADIKADPSLSATDRSSLVKAAAAATIKSNHWSQFTTGGSYTQTQNGTFYYNGSRVWVTETVSGKKGSHACFTNYVVAPYEISNVSKSDSGSTTSRKLNCKWNVKQIIPVTTSAEMTATLSKTGGISGFGSSVG
jgi:hypothetical protein